MYRYTSYLSDLARSEKVALQVAIDAALVLLCFYGAMALRLDNLDFFTNQRLWLPLAIVAATTVAIYWLTGLYTTLVRYITGRILLTVVQGALLSAFVLYSATAILGVNIPRSVPIIYAVLLFLSVGGLRFVARFLFRRHRTSSRRPVIVYGAGQAGQQVLNALYHDPHYAPVALVDDDPKIQRLTVGGLRVFSPTDISRVAARKGVKTVLLAMEAVSRGRRREIVKGLQGLELEIKTIPNMSDVINGRAKISEFRNIQPEELLGRDPVLPDQNLLKHNVHDKVVMVTGAGGSIGSELCRQILSLAPRSLLLFEISEYALYAIASELEEDAKQLTRPVRIIPILGSVQDDRRVESAIRSFQVHTIYHTAAYKHVPLVEDNIVEGIRNNVFGTLAVSSAAKSCEVESFILVSTDKAVRPTNIMGATKRIAELICQAMAHEQSSTIFSMVRFGNVLGSSGSVIPRFRAQIESGGPVTVTHRDVTRYFMTIPEAAELVIQAGAMAKGGDVFLLDMGQPVKILDLAIDMVRMHGLIPYEVDQPDTLCPVLGDIPICFTGLRKGEKLFEELLIGNEQALTSHPRIMTASEQHLSWDVLMKHLDSIKAACERNDVASLINSLLSMPLNYRPTSKDNLRANRTEQG